MQASYDSLQQRIADLESAVQRGELIIGSLLHQRERLESFLRSFLNPEERGHAVPAHVRDDVRELLGMKRVETTGEEPR